jgi:high-affinity nickel permease
MSLASILVLGFFLGMRHATDADHVVAVSTIVSRERTLRGTAPVGLAWGVGHTATILVVGGMMVIFGVVISPRMGLGMELFVALMLVALGAISIRRILREERLQARGAGHEHRHGATNAEPLGWLDASLGRLSASRVVRPLVVGVVHGLAGSAAVALLVLSTVRSATTAIAYLLVFGVGTIAGMGLVTTALAAPLVLTTGRFERMHRFVGVASGLLSVGLGIYVGYQIAFVHGLFGASPQWTPQ